MSSFQNVGHADRLKTAAQAKAALLAKFKPKAAVTDPQFEDRAALRAAELTAVRKERSAARALIKAEAVEQQAAQDQAQAALAEEALAAKRGARKERKALTNAEAKAKRDARYAARKARA